MYCCMEILGIVKRTKVLPDAAKKQFEVLLPDELKQDYLNAIEKCIPVAKGVKDTCELGFVLTKCFKSSMSKLYFP